tara:strand:+ start:672 stop:938 length:267 start_codon:yes stop_codon:yes gene_type:complete
MGKKKKSDGYTSKGLHSNVSKDTRKAMRRDRSLLETTRNKYAAFKRGKNVMLTIPNPSAKTEPAKPFIRVNAKEVWRNPNEVYMMKKS